MAGLTGALRVAEEIPPLGRYPLRRRWPWRPGDRQVYAGYLRPGVTKGDRAAASPRLDRALGKK